MMRTIDDAVHVLREPWSRATYDESHRFIYKLSDEGRVSDRLLDYWNIILERGDSLVCKYTIVGH